MSSLLCLSSVGECGCESIDFQFGASFILSIRCQGDAIQDLTLCFLLFPCEAQQAGWKWSSLWGEEVSLCDTLQVHDESGDTVCFQMPSVFVI